MKKGRTLYRSDRKGLEKITPTDKWTKGTVKASYFSYSKDYPEHWVSHSQGIKKPFSKEESSIYSFRVKRDLDIFNPSSDSDIARLTQLLHERGDDVVYSYSGRNERTGIPYSKEFTGHDMVREIGKHLEKYPDKKSHLSRYRLLTEKMAHLIKEAGFDGFACNDHDLPDENVALFDPNSVLERVSEEDV